LSSEILVGLEQAPEQLRLHAVFPSVAIQQHVEFAVVGSSKFDVVHSAMHVMKFPHVGRQTPPHGVIGEPENGLVL
jgi:hypothetical protein